MNAQSGEIEGTAAFVNLHGIAAAHGDVRLGFAIEVGKFAVRAGAAFRIAGDADGLQAAGPDIAGEETAVELVGMTGEEFQGFGDLERGD